MNLLIKLIKPGWGSNGYYPADVLAQYGAVAFPAETRILNTHVNNNSSSPARLGQGVSGDDLVAKLVEDAYYDEGGASGAGLYAKVAVYQDYVERWGVEKLRDMQFSIFALVKWAEGEVDGVSGLIAQSLHPTALNTVDAVVFGGAGGHTVAVESAELCDGDDCPIVHLDVQIAETTLTEQLQMLHDAFSRQFPTWVETDDGMLQTYARFVDADDEYIYIVNDKQNVYYRARYQINDDGTITIDPRDDWELVTVMRSYEPITPTSEADGNGESNMELQQALSQIAELKAQIDQSAAESKELRTTNSALQAQVDNLNAERRGVLTEQAVTNVLRDVTFVDDEARQLVAEKLTNGVVWKGDKIDDAALKLAAKPYVEGTSGLVAEKLTDDSYLHEQYTPVPQGSNGTSGHVTILSNATSGDFAF